MPVDGSRWIESTFQFNKDFIENYSEYSDERYFLKVDVQYAKNLHNSHNDLPFLPTCMIKKNVWCT